jgi:NADH-quinone oxidoreductase subunit N
MNSKLDNISKQTEYLGWSDFDGFSGLVQILLPEISLSVFAMLALLGAVYGGKDKVSSVVLWATVVIFLLIAIYISFQGAETHTVFGKAFIDDPYSRFLKVVILLSTASVLIMSQEFLKRNSLFKFEYPILIILSVIGMMLMVSAGDLMLLYMGLELQSLSLYVLAAFSRDSIKSTEAGLKYFVLGALSSGMLLYGASLIYGYSGSTVFTEIFRVAAIDNNSLGFVFGLVFVLIGLAFKVSAVPFHMWTPDVYEGSPTPVTALFATAPKVAAMGLLARIVHDAFGGAVNDWSQILILLSILSMLFGAVAAIGQRDIKRLMAYSSISHMGFALMGLASGGLDGVQSMLIYMVIYVIMNIGTFSFILSMEKDGQSISDIDSLQMYSKSNPGNSLALLILLFSLAGIPPLLGFFGKFYVLKAAISADLFFLAVIGVVASVIGAFYYLRIVFYIYFGEDNRELDPSMSILNQTVLIISASAMLFGIVNLFGIEALSEIAARALVN